MITKLHEIQNDVVDCAREIYYARKHLRDLPIPANEVDWALANLQAALDRLGVRKPEDVGLSAISLGEK